MPIYEYRCQACGHTLDWLQKVSDAPLTECPSCKEPALKRLISAPSFRLKGGGWYETDFKSEKDKKRNLAETAGSDAGTKEADKGKATEKAKPSDEKAPKSSEASGAKPEKKGGKGKGSEAA
jgi:putative FmdB family regulatory protein